MMGFLEVRVPSKGVVAGHATVERRGFRLSYSDLEVTS